MFPLHLYWCHNSLCMVCLLGIGLSLLCCSLPTCLICSKLVRTTASLPLHADRCSLPCLSLLALQIVLAAWQRGTPRSPSPISSCQKTVYWQMTFTAGSSNCSR